MEKKNYYFLLVGLIAIAVACSPKMQTYDLDDEIAVSMHYQPVITEGSTAKPVVEDADSKLVGIPAKTFYGGDLKRGGIWWAGKGISLEKGEIFIFTADSITSDSVPFGATFPPLDLIKEEVMVKISARAESKDGNSPLIYMQVSDASGYQANAKRPSNKIENSEDFKDYFFTTKDIFVQKEPKQKVNGAMINSIKFFIDPGQTVYTGNIFIKEIKVVPVVK